MPAGKIQADYDQLQAVSSKFSQQAEVVAQLSQDVRSKMDALQGGGWVGQGANSFFSEMEETVLPAIERLRGALEQASEVTRMVHDRFHQTEQDASALFRR